MKRLVADRKATKLTHELKELETYGTDELKQRWRKLYGTSPPPKIYRSLLLAAIARHAGEGLGRAQSLGPPPSYSGGQSSGGVPTLS